MKTDYPSDADALSQERKAYRRLRIAQAKWIEAANAIHGASYHLRELIDSVGQQSPNQSFPVRRKIQVPLRVAVMIRDGNKCRHCSSTSDLCLDHIKPVSAGGLDVMENLQTLCRSCNSKKGVS